MSAVVVVPMRKPTLRFVPTELEVGPLVGYGVALRVIAMAEAMASFIPADQQDEAYREGIRALREEG